MALVFIFCFLLPAVSASQPIPDSVQVSAEPAQHPDSEPYESSRTVVQHILASPAYLFHWVTRPIGSGIKFAERKFPNLFKGEPGDFVVYPWLEAGGEKGVTAGVLTMHRDFLNKGHKIRYEMRFGSAKNNDFDFEYTVPELFAAHSSTELSVEYGNDAREPFFNGNDVPLAQLREYSEEVFETELIQVFFKNRPLKLRLNPNYRQVIIREGVDFEGGNRLPFPDNLKGRYDIAAFRTSFIFDATRGDRRNVNGYRILADLGINQSLNNRDNTYLNYRLEWQKFLPLGFVPDTRRLAFRTFLQKVEPLSDEQVPVFDLPSLGDSRTLRGFDNDRVREEGALHATLEYRFPMWDFVDVNLFVDEGQVFNGFGDIALNDFRTSYGFGFHLLNQKNVSVRMEFAFSKETSRTILTIGGNF